MIIKFEFILLIRKGSSHVENSGYPYRERKVGRVAYIATLPSIRKTSVQGSVRSLRC